MSDFSTSLLREKFVIRDAMPVDMTDNQPIIALSNRIKFTLRAKRHNKEDSVETYVVRAQNMHMTARYAAQMAKHFQDYKSLVGEAKFKWDKAYHSITKGYEEKWNPHRWVAIYHNGRIVFEAGEVERHHFLDIIEQCDARNHDDYEKTMEIAKDAFKQAGKLVDIEHDANVALIMKITETEGKCGVILRGPNKTTTFNFNAHPKGGRAVRPSQCLTTAAAFLEGIQLAFLIGMTKQKVKYDLIDAASEEAKKADAASQKLGRLNSAIMQFESLLNVNYRPDRPNFAAMVDDAEEFAQKVLGNEIKTRIESGELDKGDWVV